MIDKALAMESRYAYLFGRIKCLESKLIAWERLEKLRTAADATEAVRMMAELGYGDLPLPGTGDTEAALMSELRWTYESLLPDVPDRRYLDLFFVEYDVHNLKVLLKNRLCGGPRSDAAALLEAGTVERGRFEGLLDSDPQAIAEAFPEYSGAVTRAVALFGDTGDISVVDSVLDAALHGKMAELAAGNGLLEAFVVLRADMGNMKLAARARDLGRSREGIYFLPGGTVAEAELRSLYDKGCTEVMARFARKYGKVLSPILDSHGRTGSWMGLERRASDAMLETARAVGYIMGPETLAGYVLAKKHEIEALRSILVSKFAGIPAERVRGAWGA